MKIYESPKAAVVAFEVVNIITTSVAVPEDTPEVLTTWGNRIADVGSRSIFD